MILEKNKKINIIGQNTASKKAIIERHIIDSAQIIDFVDLNSNTTTDIGSGAGMPGIIVAIILKNMKNNMNVHLYEKSFHKSNFLKEVSRKFQLNVEVFQKDIFDQKNLKSDIIVARAFKPLPIILNLINNNFKLFKEVILFLGKNGNAILNEALMEWEFQYDLKQSMTNIESTIIKIKNLKKK